MQTLLTTCMNCHTCMYNRYEPASESEDPDNGMLNHCSLDPMHIGLSDSDEAIQEWVCAQTWDDELMCPLTTTPCPGWEAVVEVSDG